MSDHERTSRMHQSHSFMKQEKGDPGYEGQQAWFRIHGMTEYIDEAPKKAAEPEDSDKQVRGQEETGSVSADEVSATV